MSNQKNYLIALCDILGFSNLIYSNKLDDVVNDIIIYLKKPLSHSVHKGSFSENFNSLDEFKKKSKVGLALFSDTILFYTLNDTDEDCKNLLETCGWLLFYSMFPDTTRLRIGISYGEAYIDSNIDLYLGKPIIEAYKLEKAQNWSGGALTKNAENRIPEYVKTELLSIENKMNSGLYYDWYLTYYNVPLKGKISQRLLSIDWTRGFHDNSPFDWLDSFLYSPNQNNKIRPDIIEKWKNTKRFHDDLCYQCRDQ